MDPKTDVGLITEHHTPPLASSPSFMLVSELQTFGDVSVVKWILNSSHTPKDTSLIEPATYCTCRGLNAQPRPDDARSRDRGPDGGSSDQSTVMDKSSDIRLCFVVSHEPRQYNNSLWHLSTLS